MWLQQNSISQIFVFNSRYELWFKIGEFDSCTEGVQLGSGSLNVLISYLEMMNENIQLQMDTVFFQTLTLKDRQ